MLYGFFGRVSSAPQMRDALDASSQRIKAIAQRVSGATLQNQTGFALPDGTTAPGEAVNLEAEMTSLADEQLRYEATAKLLERTYTRLRQVVRDR
jgi:flagellar basal body rod protein FlgB